MILSRFTHQVARLSFIGLLLTVCFTERLAAADSTPLALDPVTIVPVYWGAVAPELQAVLPAFYSDFTSEWVPNGYTQTLSEYGAGKTMSFDNPYASKYPYSMVRT